MACKDLSTAGATEWLRVWRASPSAGWNLERNEIWMAQKSTGVFSAFLN